MIRRLQRRFILIAMCAVFVVLAIIMGIINITNYLEVISESDKTLSMLVENGGAFPKNDYENGNGGNNIGSGGVNDKNGAQPRKPMGNMSAEAPFETRFFSVVIGNEEQVLSVKTGNIAAVTEDKAIEYAKQIIQGGTKKGFVSVYRYYVSKSDQGTLVMFLDCSRGLKIYNNFLEASFAVSFAGILGVFVIVLLLSKRAIKPVAESYEKQKHFITDASHELKTPLTVISANTEVLEMTQGENEWTQSIHNQVKRLTELTNSLVSLARMDESDSKLIMIDFSISDAVSESAEAFKQLAVSQGKELAVNIQKNLSYTGNEESIRKLVGILVDNAIKYSDENGSISVSLKSLGKGIVFQVQNSVASIEKGNREELFERFYRGDDSRNSQVGGYGIGLSIARAIVSAHKGKITARSEDGKSLIISITL